jgi:hypothetical protein
MTELVQPRVISTTPHRLLALRGVASLLDMVPSVVAAAPVIAG